MLHILAIDPTGADGSYLEKAMPEMRPTISARAFENLRGSVSNWGRWGADDERGTMHHLTPDRVVAAAALVRTGRTVTLSHPLDPVPGPDNPKPALHFMSQLADVDPGEPRSNMDFIGTDFHGKSVTHIDAFAHCAYRGQLYNGVPQSSVSAAGATRGSVMTVGHGIVGRGVLLDVPRFRGVPWLDPGTAVTPDELERVEDAQGVRVREGDIVLVRTGHARRRAELGAWDASEEIAGLHPSAMPWLHARGAAVLGGDGDSDARPSGVDGVHSPIHALAIAAMGMHLLDNVNLEDLASACVEEERWAFLCVVAPLRIPGGTGSPVNPIAVF